MKHYGAEGRATHARIRDTDEIAHALLQELRWYRQIARLRHARIAFGSTVLQHHHAIGGDGEFGIFHARMEILDVFEHHGRAGMPHQGRGCRRCLDNRTIGAKIAAQYSEAAGRLQRAIEGADDIAIIARGITAIGPNTCTIRGQCLFDDKIVLAEFADHGSKAACAVKILHQICARGLHVNQRRHVPAQPVPIVKRRSWRTISTQRRPARRARTWRLASTAGIAALPGRPTPNASTMQAMVEAVPMMLQCPCERFRHVSASRTSIKLARPARASSDNVQTSATPKRFPCRKPFSIGPPDTPIVGRSTLAAPISKAGVVLSQPISRTTPSNGLARSDSSTSILTRLR